MEVTNPLFEQFQFTVSDSPYKIYEMAVDDFDKCMNENYIGNMAVWHTPSNKTLNTISPPNSDGNECHVCLAGAVLAQTCNAEPHQDANLGGGIWDFINDMRCGLFKEAMMELVDDNDLVKSEDIPRWWKIFVEVATEGGEEDGFIFVQSSNDHDAVQHRQETVEWDLFKTLNYDEVEYDDYMKFQRKIVKYLKLTEERMFNGVDSKTTDGKQ